MKQGMTQQRSTLIRTTVLALAIPVLVTGCAIGPDYQRPTVDVGTAYKEHRDWKPARPQDELIRGKWWEVFGDADLNALAAQIDVSNQNLKAAEARYRQAASLVQSARSGFLPSFTASTGASRSRAASRGGPDPDAATAYRAAVSAAWEVDVWGRVRRQLESSSASAEASRADLEAVRLSLQSELAINYFQLRVTDQLKQLLDDTVAAYRRSLDLTTNRYNVGVAAKGDVVQAQAQLRSTEAQALDLGVTRAQLEHAIATLIGKPPSAFSLASKPFTLKMPRMPLGMPSTLLERRPDIAAAERRVTAANAQVGVAMAAYFPTLSLTGAVSQNNSAWSNLFSAANRSWSLGPELAVTLLDFGKRGAATDSAMATYDQTVANYRQTVLDALQEVEDNLVALRILEEEAVVQADAVKLARESVLLTTNQYKAGTVSYLNVVTVQASQLANERTSVSLLGRQLTAAVGLIRALGGGWTASELAEQK